MVRKTRRADPPRVAIPVAARMQKTQHPAPKLMADPFDKQLIAEHMAWGEDNAIKQIEEVERLIKEHQLRAQISGRAAPGR
jgi:hypothetical protein